MPIGSSKFDGLVVTIDNLGQINKRRQVRLLHCVTEKSNVTRVLGRFENPEVPVVIWWCHATPSTPGSDRSGTLGRYLTLDAIPKI